MSTLTVNNARFDVVEYIKRLRQAGASQEIAEIQAQELEHVLGVAVTLAKEDLKSKELVTKQDLFVTKLELQTEMEVVRKEIEVVRKEIAELRYTMLKFIIWTGCGVTLIVLGGMYTMLKLMLQPL